MTWNPTKDDCFPIVGEMCIGTLWRWHENFCIFLLMNKWTLRNRERTCFCACQQKCYRKKCSLFALEF